MDFSRQYDVLVIGGGNAALCAAITARGRGLDVLVVESAPIHFRGGNSRHTRNMRTMHEGPLDALTDAYPEEEYWQDLLKVTGGLTDETLARLTIRQTEGHVALDETARRAIPAAARRHACSLRAPTPSFWAAARRSSTPTTPRPQRSAWTSRMNPKSSTSICATGALSRRR